MPSSAYQVHRCRFVDWVPDGINCISLHAELPLLAVGRATGDIELWNGSNGWHFERRIAGTESNSVQTMCWLGDRLFSAGLQGTIVEWDLTRLQPKRRHDSYGGAVWSLAPSHSGKWLAAGCEDGTVRLFALHSDDAAPDVDAADGADAEEPGAGEALVYRRSFTKQPGRITSVAWHADDQELVSGASDGTIRRWSFEAGRPSVVMNVEHPGQKRAAIVWSVAVLRDWTVVSGDSFGHTQLWDGTMGTLLHSFRQHAADVLAVAVTADERTVFSAGVDHKVAQLRLVPASAAVDAAAAASGGSKWVYSSSQRWHSHDIRALAVKGDRLYSAGVDTRICIYPVDIFATAGHSDMVRLTPYPQRPMLQLAREPRMLLCQHRRLLQLYHLGTAAPSTTPLHEVRSGTALPVSERYRHLLDLRIASSSNLLSSALSPDGRFVLASDASRFKLFEVLLLQQPTPSAAGAAGAGAAATVRKLRLPRTMRDAGLAAARAVFSADSRRVLVADLDRRLHLLDLPPPHSSAAAAASASAGAVRHVHTFDTFLRLESPSSADAADADTEAADGSGHARRQRRRASAAAAAAAAAEGGESGKSRLQREGPIVALALSSDGRWAAASDTVSRIHVFDLTTLQHHCTLPRFDSGTACLAFRPGSSLLAVATAAFGLHVYDVAARSLTRWSRENAGLVPVHIIGNRSKWLGASFSETQPDLLLLYANGFFALVNIAEPLEPLPASSAGGSGSGSSGDESQQQQQHWTAPSDLSNFKIVSTFKPTLYVDFVSESELVTIERPWDAILPHLPAALFRVRYGT